MYPNSSYSEALNKSGLDRLDYRRDLITKNLLREREIKDWLKIKVSAPCDFLFMCAVYKYTYLLTYLLIYLLTCLYSMTHDEQVPIWPTEQESLKTERLEWW